MKVITISKTNKTNKTDKMENENKLEGAEKEFIYSPEFPPLSEMSEALVKTKSKKWLAEELDVSRPTLDRKLSGATRWRKLEVEFLEFNYLLYCEKGWVDAMEGDLIDDNI